MAPDVPLPETDPLPTYISPELPPLEFVAEAVLRLKSPETPVDEAPDKILTEPPEYVVPAAPPLREIDPPEVEPVPAVREREPPTPAEAMPAEIATFPPVVVPFPTLREIAPDEPDFDAPLDNKIPPVSPAAEAPEDKAMEPLTLFDVVAVLVEIVIVPLDFVDPPVVKTTFPPEVKEPGESVNEPPEEEADKPAEITTFPDWLEEEPDEIKMSPERPETVWPDSRVILPLGDVEIASAEAIVTLPEALVEPEAPLCRIILPPVLNEE